MLKKNVYILLDRSGSMANGSNDYNRADAVNRGMEGICLEVAPEVGKDAMVEVTVSVIAFNGNTVEFIIDRMKMEEFTEWMDIDNDSFYGGTPTGKAIKVVADDINTGCNGDKDPQSIPPAILLISMDFFSTLSSNTTRIYIDFPSQESHLNALCVKFF